MSQKRSSKSSRNSSHNNSTTKASAPLDFQEELERYQTSVKILEEKRRKIKLRLEAFKELHEQLTKSKGFQEQITRSFSVYIKGVETSELDGFTKSLLKSRIGKISDNIRDLMRQLNREIEDAVKDPIPWYESELETHKTKIESQEKQAKGYIEDKDAAGLRELAKGQEEFSESKDRIHPRYKYW